MRLANWRYSTGLPAMRVFLCGGQSNGTGRGSPRDAAVDVGGASVYQWTRGGALERITAGKDPLDHVDQNGLVGPFVAFARAYSAANPSHKVLLVPVAKGGSSFYKNDWNEGDPIYEEAIARMNAAMNSNSGNIFSGILWQHGETDTETSGSRAAYQGALDALIGRFRSVITGGSTSTRVIVGGMVPEWVAAVANRAVIQAILADTPNRIVNAAYANPELPTPLNGGNLDANIHYSAANQRVNGNDRYWTAWQSLG